LGEATFIASNQNRQNATFRVVHGLAGQNCFSFESVSHPGMYLRHKDGRIRLDVNDGGQFAGDATFCETFALGGILGITSEGFSLASYNMPGYHIVRVNDQLLLQFRQLNVNWESAASFEIAQPLWHQMTQPAQPANTGEIDFNSYYRLTNAEAGDTKSLEAKQVLSNSPNKWNDRIDMLMGQTSADNRGQYWIIVRKSYGYQLVNAAIGNDQMVTIRPELQDGYRYREKPIVMERTSNGIAFNFKALGDGYFVLQAGNSVLEFIPRGHRSFELGPALVPQEYPRNIPSRHKWKLTKVGPIQ
jgi:hypothetical protein